MIRRPVSYVVGVSALFFFFRHFDSFMTGFMIVADLNILFHFFYLMLLSCLEKNIYIILIMIILFIL